MTELKKWEPLWAPSLFTHFPRTMDDLLRSSWEGFFAPLSQQREPGSAWVPHVSLTETPEAYEVRAEVAGVKPEDIKVTLTGDRLTIQGEKRKEERREEDHVHVYERSYGSFQRSFSFPNPVDQGAVQAESKDGVVTIKVKKSAKEQPLQVKIQSK